MSKLLVVLLSLVISHEAVAFGKKATETPPPATAAVAVPAQEETPVPKAPKPTKAVPVSQPKPQAKPVKTSLPTPEQEAAIENLNQDADVKPAPKVIKKVEKVAKPKPAAPVMTAAKQQEMDAIKFLKAKKWCGKSAVPGVSTTGDAHQSNRLRNVYAYDDIPPAVKAVIDQQVDQCDKDQKVGKYYVNPLAEQPAPVAVVTPAAVPAEDTVGDSAKKVGDFFNKLGSDITKNGVKDKVCSPGEIQMHVNGC